MDRITVDDKYVYSEAELLSAISSTMHDSRYETVVIMAGHFMLFFDPVLKCLRPGVFEDIDTEPLHTQVKDRVGVFPSYTWGLGIRLAERYYNAHEKRAKLLLLVNDWQYVPDAGRAGDFRTSFYDTFQDMPNSYARQLANSQHLSTKDIIPSRRHAIAFPETWLKYRFQNAAAQLVKAGKLQKRYLEDKVGQSEVSFIDSQGASLPLISCGITGCAGEITEMISEVYKAGTRYMIIFAPSECHSPIRTGIEIALSLYDLTNMKVVVANPGGSGEMTHRNIFENGVNVAVFQS